MTRPNEDAPATGALDEYDAAVLAQLAGVYAQLDPLPAGLVERISFGITLDALEAEVARLQRDAVRPAGVRTENVVDVETVTFTSSALTAMVSIAILSADRVRIDGWIAPGAGVQVEVRLTSGTRRTVADQDGRFAFDDVPRGYVQFVLRSGADAVITPSLEV